MITTGAIVTVRKHGDIAFVVYSRMSDRRWRVISKALDERGREAFSGKVVGEGDITLIRATPTYEIGATVEHNGLSHTVSADLGEFVQLNVPSARHPLRGGGHLQTAAGNRTTVTKAELVLASLGQTKKE